MNRGLAIALSSAAIFGSLYLFIAGFQRGPHPVALIAATVCVAAAAVILHRSGMKPRTIAIAVGAVPMLLGLYVLLLWLSLRNWDGPRW